MVWYSEGKGRLLDAHTVRIALSAGGEQTITANRILLATGNKAVKLDIPGKVPVGARKKRITVMSSCPAGSLHHFGRGTCSR